MINGARWLALIFLITACGSLPKNIDSKKSLNVGKILNQVNEAIISSVDPNDKDFPPVSSVTLDLQVAVATSFDGKLPIDLLTAGIEVDKESVHHITLTFVPGGSPTPVAAPTDPKAPLAPLAPVAAAAAKPATAQPATVATPTKPATPTPVPGPPDPRLAEAIRAVYKSVSTAHSAYKFQYGSITLQCTLKVQADATLSLVPISLEGNTSNQTVQSLTMNFGIPLRNGGNKAPATTPITSGPIGTTTSQVEM